MAEGDEVRSLPHDKGNKEDDTVVPRGIREDRMQAIWRMLKWIRWFRKSVMPEGE
jgi:hypothetical protein